MTYINHQSSSNSWSRFFPVSTGKSKKEDENLILFHCVNVQMLHWLRVLFGWTVVFRSIKVSCVARLAGRVPDCSAARLPRPSCLNPIVHLAGNICRWKCMDVNIITERWWSIGPEPLRPVKLLSANSSGGGRNTKGIYATNYSASAYSLHYILCPYAIRGGLTNTQRGVIV